MTAYDEVYLQEIVETQGKLFEDVSELEPGIDVKDFIIKYMKSKTRRYLDKAQAYVATMNVDELWEYFKRTDSFQAKQGDEIGGFIPNWIGQFYAYFQWYFNLSSENVIEIIPLDFMIAGYRGLHDLDLELAVKKVGEQVKRNAEDCMLS